MIRELKETYRQVVVELVEFGFSHGVKTFTGLKAHVSCLEGEVPAAAVPLCTHCMSRCRDQD